MNKLKKYVCPRCCLIMVSPAPTHSTIISTQIFLNFFGSNSKLERILLVCLVSLHQLHLQSVKLCLTLFFRQTKLISSFTHQFSKKLLISVTNRSCFICFCSFIGLAPVFVIPPFAMMLFEMNRPLTLSLNYFMNEWYN